MVNGNYYEIAFLRAIGPKVFGSESWFLYTTLLLNDIPSHSVLSGNLTQFKTSGLWQNKYENN